MSFHFRGARSGRRWPAAVLTVVAALWLFGTLLTACHMSGEPGETKGPEPSQAERAFYSRMAMSEVTQYFYQTYGAELGTDEEKWASDFGGEIPNQVMEQRIREQKDYDDALRALAEEYGEEPLPPLEQMETEREAFNRRRQEELAGGEVIYGPETYGALEYYLYRRERTETALVGAIMDEALENRRDVLRRRYDGTPTEELTGKRRAVLAVYAIDSEEFADEPRAEAALERLMEGEDGAQEELSRMAGLPVSRSELELDSAALSREDSFSADLLSRAQTAGEGACFRAPRSAGADFDCVYRVISFNFGERPTFEESIMTVAASYANEVFEERTRTK